jgi:hypothetical protein
MSPTAPAAARGAHEFRVADEDDCWLRPGFRGRNARLRRVAESCLISSRRHETFRTRRRGSLEELSYHSQYRDRPRLSLGGLGVALLGRSILGGQRCKSYLVS